MGNMIWQIVLTVIAIVVLCPPRYTLPAGRACEDCGEEHLLENGECPHKMMQTSSTEE